MRCIPIDPQHPRQVGILLVSELCSVFPQHRLQSSVEPVYHPIALGMVYMNHFAVRAILKTPSPSGKHARWQSKVYGSGVRSIQIIHRAGKDNANADALSRNPQSSAPATDPEEADSEVQGASITSNCTASLDISSLLEAEPASSI